MENPGLIHRRGMENDAEALGKQACNVFREQPKNDTNETHTRSAANHCGSFDSQLLKESSNFTAPDQLSMSRMNYAVRHELQQIGLLEELDEVFIPSCIRNIAHDPPAQDVKSTSREEQSLKQKNVREHNVIEQQNIEQYNFNKRHIPGPRDRYVEELVTRTGPGLGDGPSNLPFHIAEHNQTAPRQVTFPNPEIDRRYLNPQNDLRNGTSRKRPSRVRRNVLVSSKVNRSTPKKKSFVVLDQRRRLTPNLPNRPGSLDLRRAVKMDSISQMYQPLDDDGFRIPRKRAKTDSEQEKNQERNALITPAAAPEVEEHGALLANFGELRHGSSSVQHNRESSEMFGFTTELREQTGTRLSDVLMGKLNGIFKRGIVKTEDIDRRVCRYLSSLPIKRAIYSIEALCSVNFEQVTNRPAYLLGVLRRASSCAVPTTKADIVYVPDFSLAHLPGEIAESLRYVFYVGNCHPADFDDRAMNALVDLPFDRAMEALYYFSRPLREPLRNPSAYFIGIVKQLGRKNNRFPNHEEDLVEEDDGKLYRGLISNHFSSDTESKLKILEEEGKLDEGALQALRTLSEKDVSWVIRGLTDLSRLRNASAYTMARCRAIHERIEAGRAGYRLGLR